MDSLSSFAEFESLIQAHTPHVAMILGSGMSGLADRCQVLGRVAYTHVPGMSATSVAGHRGSLALGEWVDKRVLFFEGRLHRYEGHSWEDVVRPVRLAHQLGARVLFLTNAAGGIRDSLGPGSIMPIRDHLEWTWPYAWKRPGPGGLGGTRPSPYDVHLLEVLERAGKDLRLELIPGIYATVTGPSYESRAEIRALKSLGADAVGMSTAREIQQGRDLGMACAALSCITNKAAGLSDTPINHEEVLTTAKAQAETLSDLLETFLRLLVA